MWTEKKSIKKDSMFQTYMRRYHTHQILKYFGLSFLDFISLPIDKCEDMFKMTNIFSADDAKRATVQAAELEKELSGIDSQMSKADEEYTRSYMGPNYRPDSQK